MFYTSGSPEAKALRSKYKLYLYKYPSFEHITYNGRLLGEAINRIPELKNYINCIDKIEDRGYWHKIAFKGYWSKHSKERCIIFMEFNPKTLEVEMSYMADDKYGNEYCRTNYTVEEPINLDVWIKGQKKY